MTAFLRKNYAKLTPDRALLLWLSLWWIANLLQAGFSELANDEAYYHLFAQRLDWGYFDHPPVTALLVRAGEWLFGATELGVRFFFTLLQPLYLWILWRLVRPADATRSDAELYALIAAATLMLQLYGFIAVPDGPLLCSSALFLLAFRAFADRRMLAWLGLGAAMALMAYSKYHGALVVIFALAANPRLLLRPKLYAAGAVTLLLLVPHLVWQQNHNWASLAYHLSGRNSDFEWSDVGDYLLNMLVVFNPFFVPLYIRAFGSVRPQTPVQRALKLLPPAFIGFFLLSSLRGYVQPQWVIVASFGLLYLLFCYARRHPRTRRYVMRAGAATILLVALVRLEMIFNPLGLKFQVFDNRAIYGRIAEIAAGRPVVFSHSYSEAAKYMFYTGGEAYCQPDIRYRTHHWQFRDDDERFAGREAVIQTSWQMADDLQLGVQREQLADGSDFYWFSDPDFRPLRRVAVDFAGLPDEVHPGQELHLELELRNPYPYDIRVNGDPELVMLWKHGRFRVEEFPAGAEPFTIPAGGAAACTVMLRVPECLAGERFDAGFALRRRGYVHWFNGKPQRGIKVAER